MELMILPPCMINLPGTGTIIKSPARIRLERGKPNYKIEIYKILIIHRNGRTGVTRKY
jgi:hypothetical protein